MKRAVRQRSLLFLFVKIQLDAWFRLVFLHLVPLGHLLNHERALIDLVGQYEPNPIMIRHHRL